LDLRFADNKSLGDAVGGGSLVTFTRASSGTFTGSDGLLKTAVTNLLTYSEQFDNAAWTKTDCTITANTIVSPNGSLTGDSIISNAGVLGRVTQNTSQITDTTYTFSTFAKANQYTFCQLRLTGAVVVAITRAYFNLATGTITGAVNCTASIAPVGDGWYRCSITYSTTSTATATPRIYGQVDAADTVGDGTSGIYIWGAQMEQSSTLGEYIPTVAAINSAPRFDHNPTTGESLGLLVEEARTNLFTRSEEFNDAAWTKTNSTITANAATAPDGTLTADKHIPDNGATIGVGASDTRVFQSPSVTSGTVYTFSIYAKASEYNQIQFSLIATPTITARFSLNLGTVLSGTGATITPAGDGWYRCAIPVTAGVTGVLAVRWSAQSSIATIGDGTSGIFAWGAQFEVGAFPTSVIPTTTATVTRAADVASITGANFTSFYNQTEGTVFANYAERAFSATHQIASVSNNTAVERISLAINASNVLDIGVISGSIDTFGGNTPTLTAQEYRIGFGYKADNSGVSANGSAITVDSAVTLPTVSQLDIGARAGSNQILNSTIKRLTYWPIRLADTTLQAISQP
jgi:hypothetical protein